MPALSEDPGRPALSQDPGRPALSQDPGRPALSEDPGMLRRTLSRVRPRFRPAAADLGRGWMSDQQRVRPRLLLRLLLLPPRPTVSRCLR